MITGKLTKKHCWSKFMSNINDQLIELSRVLNNINNQVNLNELSICTMMNKVILIRDKNFESLNSMKAYIIMSWE